MISLPRLVIVGAHSGTGKFTPAAAKSVGIKILNHRER